MNTKTLRLIVVLGGLTLVQGCGDGQEAAPPGQQQPPQAGAAAKPSQGPRALQAAEPVGEAPFDLSYLDQDTELFVFAHPAAILESPFVQAMTGGRLDWIDEIREQVGISVDQVDTVTIGIRELQQLSQQGQQQFAQMQGAAASTRGKGAPPSVDAAENTILVVRTIEPVSIDDLKLDQTEKGSRTERTHASTTYYRLPGAAGENGYLYLADPTTLIIAGEAAIKGIIDQGDKLPLPPVNLSFIPAAADVIVAVAPQDREALFGGTQNRRPGTSGGSVASLSLDEMEESFLLGDGEFDEEDMEEFARFRTQGATGRAGSAGRASLDGPLQAHVKAGALLVNFEADLRFDVLVHCDTAQAADEIHGAAEEAVSSATQAFEDAQQMLPGVLQQIGRAVLDTVQSHAEDSVVTISAALPESQQANLAVVPMAIMGMMMTGSIAAEDIGPLVDWQNRARDVLDRGQPPVSAESLPSGVELRALARWGIPPSGDPLAAEPLEVAIVATGPTVAEVVAFGQLELTEVDPGAGVRLKWLGAAQTTRLENPARDFVRVDREALFPLHPPEGIATGYTFSLSGDAPHALPIIAGQFTLKVAGEVRDVTIASVAAALRRIDDATLREAEFAVRSATENGEPQLVFTYKNTQAIGAIEVLSANGHPLVGAASAAAAGGRVRHTFSLPADADPESLGLRVSVHEDLHDVPVSFRFEGLPLPQPQSLTPQQQALLTWTPSTLTSELPEGLMAEAQARWPTPQTGSGTGSLPFAFGGRGSQTGSRGAAANAGFGADMTEDFLPGFEDEEQPARRFRGRRGDDDDFDEDDLPSGFGNSRFGDDGGGGRRASSGASIDDFLLEAGLPDSPSTFSTSDADGLLQLAVDLTGPLAESVIALGELTVETAVSEMGGDLSFEAGLYEWQEVTDGWVDIDRDVPSAEDQPPNGLRVLFLFAPPDPPIERIARFKGTMQLRRSTGHVEAVVPNLNNRTNRRIQDRALRPYGIVIAVAIDEDQLLFRQLEGDETRIAEMFPVDQNGVQIEGVTHSTAVENENLIHYFNFARNVPPKVGIKFLINSGVRELEVPLRFRNVPVPPPPE